MASFILTILYLIRFFYWLKHNHTCTVDCHLFLQLYILSLHSIILTPLLFALHIAAVSPPLPREPMGLGFMHGMSNKVDEPEMSLKEVY